ncbi:MAG: cell cycle transcriptional regulator TrcR [Rhizobiaceae bacterium]
MSNMPLMPKATAVWLVDNTSLTFDQIATFCHLHPLEVKAIADGENAQGIRGMDPITMGQLSRDELERGQKDPTYRLKVSQSKVVVPTVKRRGPRYTPVSKRQDRPNAIRWLLRNHPELKDSQIIRLVGTTKTTIEAIREGTHWNAANLTPMDPVTLGLCTQIALDMEVQKANKGRPVPEQAENDALLPASETQDSAEDEYDARRGGEVNAASVFSKFSNLKE